MPDIFTKKKRSAVMSLIRGAGNKGTELRLIQVFRANDITGWRRGQMIRFNLQPSTSNSERSKLGVGRSKLSRGVRPDFVFPRLHVAVFVDGCFWHGCPQHGTKPKTNAAFWREKIARNRVRDKEVNRLLRAKGWKVIRVWEHELRRRVEAKLVRRLSRLCPRRPPGTRCVHPSALLQGQPLTQTTG
ncbi:MAG: very short patch repair endonuclease [Opitutae bacterium]|nr:very short patch repair endonuclease [Opitutae bacterium]